MASKDLIDKQGIRDQLFTIPTVFPVPLLFNQELSCETLSTIVKSQTKGSAFVVGDPVNGMIGTSGVLINSGFTNETIERVVNPANRWKDYLRDTHHWDSTNSNAMIDNTNHRIQF